MLRNSILIKSYYCVNNEVQLLFKCYRKSRQIHEEMA